jgi:SPP1 family predicted phage head-tail adaptor
MKIGPMRHRITIRNFITRTPSGQPTEEWSDGATIWAEVKGISGREPDSRSRKGRCYIRVWVRYRKDISASSRLLVLNGPYKGVTLNVTGPPVPDSKVPGWKFSANRGPKND